MTRKSFVSFQNSITEIALVVETVWKMFAFNMVSDITNTSLSELFTDCAIVTTAGGFFCNVLVEVFI